MSFSIAMTEADRDVLAGHLLRTDGQEDVCFALWHPSRGHSRLSALVGEPIPPRHGERHVHGNASFESTYFLRALEVAQQHGCGLALLHAHPLGAGWQATSRDDASAESGHAAQTHAATGWPLVGLTLSGDGAWSARMWSGSRRATAREDAISVRVVGPGLSVTWNERMRPAPPQTRSQVRTVSVWGSTAQRDLVRLRVGVVGLGSVGAIVAEILARTGIAELVLIDFDTVEEHNLDRMLHATIRDVRRQRSKVEMLARRLRVSATASAPAIEPLECSVVEHEGWSAALDCDVLFSCVDRPWPRAALNMAAYAHLIPVIDGGIRAEQKNGRVRRADWWSRVATPARRCLECAGQYDPGLVQTEREGRLDDPAYIAGLPEDHLLRRSENVFAFSSALASSEVLQFLSMVLSPGGLSDVGAHNYHFVTGCLDVDTTRCRLGCLYSGQLVGLGDDTTLSVIGAHPAAQQARAARAHRRSVLRRLLPARFR